MDILQMPDSPTADAPPAYEFSQQELDQKVAAAVERSITSVEEDKRQRAKKRKSSGEFEKWDENAYQEAARRLAERYSSSGGGSSSSQQPTTSEAAQSVRPLSIQKKNKTAQQPTVEARESTKERPSWYEEAQLGGGSSTSPQSTAPLNTSRRSLPSGGLQRPLDNASVVSDSSDDDHNVLPPPPFVAVDNSLDGPAYERYASHQRRQSGNQVVLRYSGDLSASPPPSPPVSPTMPNSRLRNPYDMRAMQQNLPNPQSVLQQHQQQQLHVHQQQNYQQHARRSPQPPRQQTRPTPPRPTSASAMKMPPAPPRMDFNLSMAYGRSTYGEQPTEAPSASGGAAALYNSAVASLLPAGLPSASPSSPQGRKPTPSMISTRSADSYQGRPAQQQFSQSYNQSFSNYQQTLDPNRNSYYPQQVNAPYAQQISPRPMRPVSSLSQGDQPHWQQPVHVQQQFYPR
ncbi:hypothetical protein SCHPADRAFT_286946 [Schizopora paradoxa]|uniref:Uncharacterized protein n=1 Tax=Schizopora paradoxa TaxID=27342 RepID=A0A0H2RTR2_9AGAM|nr:hypothetical protein SCHPADRAFT_286946 [Schizopora paradoxa]